METKQRQALVDEACSLLATALTTGERVHVYIDGTAWTHHLLPRNGRRTAFP